MFSYFFIASLLLFSLCNGMADDHLFSEMQNKWILQNDSFKKDCANGAQYFCHQDLLNIIKKWDELCKDDSQNRILSAKEKRSKMYSFFNNPTNGFHPLSVKLLKNPLLNDNFICLIKRAEDLNLSDNKIALLQRIVLEIATPNNAEWSYAHRRGFLLKYISQGKSATLRAYLKEGHPVNIIINKYGETALIKAVKAGSVEIVKLLLACPNLAVNFQDFNQLNTPLHWAIFNGNKEIFGLILHYPQLNINIKNVTGKTPLMLAAALNKNFFVEKILEKFPNVDLTTTDHAGNSVFDLANQNLLTLLSEHQLSLLSN